MPQLELFLIYLRPRQLFPGFADRGILYSNFVPLPEELRIEKTKLENFTEVLYLEIIENYMKRLKKLITIMPLAPRK
jgi:hypothetical protein